MMIRTRFTVTDEVEIDGEPDLVQEFLNLVQDVDGAVYWQLTDTLGREVGREPVNVGGIATRIGELNEPLPRLVIQSTPVEGPNPFEITSGRLKGNVSNVPRSVALTPEEVEATMTDDERARWQRTLSRAVIFNADPRPPYRGYAPGDYSGKCSSCGEDMMNVDKRATQCADCAYETKTSTPARDAAVQDFHDRYTDPDDGN